LEILRAVLIERDVGIEMDDGVVLRADVFRPEDTTVPVVMTLGPYGEGCATRAGTRSSGNG
jgi:predicted acyl esterase